MDLKESSSSNGLVADSNFAPGFVEKSSKESQKEILMDDDISGES